MNESSNKKVKVCRFSISVTALINELAENLGTKRLTQDELQTLINQAPVINDTSLPGYRVVQITQFNGTECHFQLALPVDNDGQISSAVGGAIKDFDSYDELAAQKNVDSCAEIIHLADDRRAASHRAQQALEREERNMASFRRQANLEGPTMPRRPFDPLPASSQLLPISPTATPSRARSSNASEIRWSHRPLGFLETVADRENSYSTTLNVGQGSTSTSSTSSSASTNAPLVIPQPRPSRLRRFLGPGHALARSNPASGGLRDSVVSEDRHRVHAPMNGLRRLQRTVSASNAPVRVPAATAQRHHADSFAGQSNTDDDLTRIRRSLDDDDGIELLRSNSAPLLS